MEESLSTGYHYTGAKQGSAPETNVFWPAQVFITFSMSANASQEETTPL